jgi:hypothetical protein
MKLMVIAALVLLIVAAAALLALNSRSDASCLRDLGNITPGERVEADFEIKNPSSEVLFLSGFDKTCGFTAKLKGSPLIPPKGKADLVIQSQSSRIRGPSGVQFILSIEQGKRISHKSYTLLWNVVGPPWLDKAEVWIDGISGSTAEITIHAIDPSQVAEIVEKPAFLDASVEGTHLALRVQKSHEPGPAGDLFVRLKGPLRNVNYLLPIQVKERPGLRLYPEYVLLPNEAVEQCQVLTLLGTEANVQISSNIPGGVRLYGHSVVLNSANLREGQEYTVTASSGKSKAVAIIRRSR